MTYSKALDHAEMLEIIAAEIARWAPDIYSSIGSFTGKPSFTATWPGDWGSAEQAGIRNLARVLITKFEQAIRDEYRAQSQPAKDGMEPEVDECG